MVWIGSVFDQGLSDGGEEYDGTKGLSQSHAEAEAIGIDERSDGNLQRFVSSSLVRKIRIKNTPLNRLEQWISNETSIMRQQYRSLTWHLNDFES